MKSMLLPALLLTGLIFGGVACEKTTVTDDKGATLTLTKPVDQSIERGTTNKIRIAIDRENFSGDVEVDFMDLPSGVEVVEDDEKIMAGDDSRDFTLRAKDDAALVEGHMARVSVKTPDGATATESFKVTVEANE